MGIIKLEPCYRYTCPDCGHINIVGHFVREIKPQEEVDTPVVIEGEKVSLNMSYYEAGPTISKHGVHCLKCEELHQIETPDI